MSHPMRNENSRIAPDGRAAACLNPRPINVSRAEGAVAGDAAKPFFELRDAGYPGSTYELIYDPRSDRLTGVCFQYPRAAEGGQAPVRVVERRAHALPHPRAERAARDQLREIISGRGEVA